MDERRGSFSCNLKLPGNQQQLLEAVAATGKPIVLVVFSGRPLVLDWAAEHVPAILEAWFPGVQAGPALARVLFGDVNRGGKLTVSMPRAVGQEPLYYNVLNTGRPADGVDLGLDIVSWGGFGRASPRCARDNSAATQKLLTPWRFHVSAGDSRVRERFPAEPSASRLLMCWSLSWWSCVYRGNRVRA
jgi:hypothetical protein